jgi:uncharacterized membrane protein
LATRIFVVVRCVFIIVGLLMQAATEGYSSEQLKKSKIVKMMLQGL